MEALKTEQQALTHANPKQLVWHSDRAGGVNTRLSHPISLYAPFRQGSVSSHFPSCFAFPLDKADEEEDTSRTAAVT